jgi:hypothetical protein
MSTKTPFEIRAELLEMSRKHLEQQYYANLELARKTWEKTLELMTLPAQSLTKVDDIVKFNKELFDAMTGQMPKPPTFEEIIKKAQELYGFVQKKD